MKNDIIDIIIIISISFICGYVFYNIQLENDLNTVIKEDSYIVYGNMNFKLIPCTTFNNSLLPDSSDLFIPEYNKTIVIENVTFCNEKTKQIIK